MSDHAQFAEGLALYALGALDNEQERAALEAHLGTCGDCRRELERLRADVALLAMSVTGPQPPQRARQRLMSAIAAEQQQAPKAEPVVVGRLRWRWLNLAPIAVAVALAVFSFGLLLEVQRLKNANAQIVAELRKEIERSKDAREIAAMLEDPKAQQVVLVPTKNPQRQPQVKTIYVRDKGHVLLIANNLPELPSNKAYQLWLLPASGGPPMSAGVFKTDWRGHYLMLHPMESAGIEAKGFAITIEPEGGSITPTPPIVMQPGN
jgi:anti-sigma-K factor RskA